MRLRRLRTEREILASAPPEKQDEVDRLVAKARQAIRHDREKIVALEARMARLEQGYGALADTLRASLSVDVPPLG